MQCRQLPLPEKNTYRVTFKKCLSPLFKMGLGLNQEFLVFLVLECKIYVPLPFSNPATQPHRHFCSCWLAHARPRKTTRQLMGWSVPYLKLIP